MGQVTLILGGARSGKSSYAQKLAAAGTGPVVYIATALTLDEEMRARVQVHQSERPPGWQTLEVPKGIAAALQAAALQASALQPRTVVLDCITMLVTNLILEASPDVDQPNEAAATAAVEAEIESLLGAIRSGPADWILVSNEVGLGLVPPYPLGRLYRDLLGRANQQLAAQASEVFLMVAGIPVPIHPFRI